MRDARGAILDALNPPTRPGGELSAPYAALEIEIHDHSVHGADAVSKFSLIAFAAAMPAIAVFLPPFQYLRHGEFLFAPAEFLRESRFAQGHSAGVEAALHRKDRFADKGVWHGSK